MMHVNRISMNIYIFNGMIGSLQEFLGGIQKQKFLQIQPKAKTKQTRANRWCSLQRTSRNEIKFEAIPPHIQDIKYEINAIVTQTIPQTSEGFLLQHIHSVVDVQSAQSKMQKATKWTQHVPDNKQNILKAFTRLRRNDEEQSNAKLMQKLKQISQQNQRRQLKQPNNVHLKGNLKHKHQLLRSIVRVEVQDKINSTTFLQLSLENMTSSYNQIKIKSFLRVDDEYPKRLFNALQKQGEQYTQDLKSLIIPSSPQNCRQRREAKSKSIRSTHRILLQNQRKWAKTRAKSMKSYEKTLGIPQATYEEQGKKMKKDRNEAFKRINQLLTQPKARRKSSQMMTSSIFFK